MVACLEEIAYRMGYITAGALEQLGAGDGVERLRPVPAPPARAGVVTVRFVPTELPGVVIVEPDVHRDGRGFFLETYHADKYRGGGIAGPFVQDNHSRSVAGTLRGLHLQVRRPQGKLIRVIEGEIFDVAVDVRRGSPTFGRWVGVTLSAENFKQCYVPAGFAHGFCVAEPDGAGRIQVHGLLRSRRTRSASPGTIPALAIAVAGRRAAACPSATGAIRRWPSCSTNCRHGPLLAAVCRVRPNPSRRRQICNRGDRSRASRRLPQLPKTLDFRRNRGHAPCHLSGSRRRSDYGRAP